jgi:hypothetical protein
MPSSHAETDYQGAGNQSDASEGSDHRAGNNT